jgi:hypothetical protein
LRSLQARKVAFQVRQAEVHIPWYRTGRQVSSSDLYLESTQFQLWSGTGCSELLQTLVQCLEQVSNTFTRTISCSLGIIIHQLIDTCEQIQQQGQVGPLLATCFHAGFFLGLSFTHEDGGIMLLWNASWLFSGLQCVIPQ